MTVAEVRMWGRTIGAVALGESAQIASFQFDPSFVQSAIAVAPLTMPPSNRVYSFPALERGTFHGLPGLLADSLPDKFGNALIDSWLLNQGRNAASFTAVERLCYTGDRGMGALEYVPTLGPSGDSSESLSVAALVELASAVLHQRSGLRTSLDAAVVPAESMRSILRVGTSAGGARAKAVIAWNPITKEVRSGQVPAGEGFSYWLLKFDGVSGNSDKELDDPQGFGSIEYAYARMARAAGIEMTECRLLEENGRRHFMTKRFDRTESGGKLHMQSLGAIAHFDFNMAGAYSYEQALLVARRLALPIAAIEEQYRRMVFNVLARNQDDHVKNIAYLMDQSGNWSLSPAFDITYSYNPAGLWTSQHQMTVNGKRDKFTVADFEACAQTASMKRGRFRSIYMEVRDAVDRWREFAEDAGVAPSWIAEIDRNLRKEIPED